MDTLPLYRIAQSFVPLTGKSLYFPRGKRQYLADWYEWKESVSNQHIEKDATTPETTVVLLSYKRPQNMRYIVWSALQCDWVEHVVIVNNNPHFLMQDFVECDDPRIVYRNEEQNLGAMQRYCAAQAYGGAFFLSIDDDLLLTPKQMTQLMQETYQNPKVPHGMFGEYLRLSKPPAMQWEHMIVHKECSVDILNRAYAFTADHLQTFFALLKKLGRTSQEDLIAMSPLDDVVLSFCGEGKPQCHDIGFFLDCPTSSQRSVAQFQQDDFLERRKELYSDLVKLTT